MLFKGAGTAIITPFNNSGIDFDKFKELIEFQIKNNIDSIIVCGTTGESSTMSDEEKKAIIKFAIDVSKKRVPIIAGTGSNNTLSSIELSKYAQSVGADGLLVVTPYYNKCTQEGLYLHFKAIAESVDIPIILYNVPSRTGVNLLPDTVKRLSGIRNIQGLKEASGNISQIAETISKLPKYFNVYSGNDDQIIPILSLGGVGVISVLSNILPLEVHDMCMLFSENKLEESRLLQFKYLELINKLFIEVNPIPIKEAMNLMNMNVGSCRLPLCDMANNNKDKLIKELKKLDLI